mgnify:CR=1 FL=1
MAEQTTVQVDKETRDKLKMLSDLDMRSMTAEVRWLVDRELAERGKIVVVNTVKYPDDL